MVLTPEWIPQLILVHHMLKRMEGEFIVVSLR
jgi:hypothetical protein